MKKRIIGIVTTVLTLTMLCACGSSADEPATTETQAPSTVTAGEAAQKEAEKVQQSEQSEAEDIDTTPGTENGAMDAALATAYEDIKDFDGSWQNLSLDVDDPIIVIEFDWGGEHYTYQYDEDAGKIVK